MGSHYKVKKKRGKEMKKASIESIMTTEDRFYGNLNIISVTVRAEDEDETAQVGMEFLEKLTCRLRHYGGKSAKITNISLSFGASIILVNTDNSVDSQRVKAIIKGITIESGMDICYQYNTNKWGVNSEVVFYGYEYALNSHNWKKYHTEDGEKVNRVF